MIYDRNAYGIFKSVWIVHTVADSNPRWIHDKEWLYRTYTTIRRQPSHPPIGLAHTRSVFSRPSASSGDLSLSLLDGFVSASSPPCHDASHRGGKCPRLARLRSTVAGYAIGGGPPEIPAKAAIPPKHPKENIDDVHPQVTLNLSHQAVRNAWRSLDGNLEEIDSYLWQRSKGYAT
jgi:hypothetical protein